MTAWAEQNQGLRRHRTKDSKREAVFARAWDSWHRGDPGGLSTSADLLFHLLQVDDPEGRPNPLMPFVTPQKLAFPIDETHRRTAATVIQWLGTNVGWCFLEEALRECGYDLVKRDG